MSNATLKCRSRVDASPLIHTPAAQRRGEVRAALRELQRPRASPLAERPAQAELREVVSRRRALEPEQTQAIVARERCACAGLRGTVGQPLPAVAALERADDALRLGAGA